MPVLRKLAREQDPKSPFVTSERGAPFTAAALARRWSERARPLGSPSRRIRIYCGMLAGSPSPTKATIPRRCKPISGTATFSTREVY